MGVQNMDIHGAARAGADEELQRIVDSGADVNQPDKLKRTALHMAAWSGKKSSLLILLKAGANVHALAVDNMTPLIFAAQNGHAECCESLLKKKANPNHKISKGRKTALHFAVHKKHVAVAELLVRKGADTACQRGDGKSALDLAAGDEQMLAALAVEPEKKKQHQQPKMTTDQKREAAKKRALEDPEDEHADKKPKVALDHLGAADAAAAEPVDEAGLKLFAAAAGLDLEGLDDETRGELLKLYLMQQQAEALQAQLTQDETTDNSAAATEATVADGDNSAAPAEATVADGDNAAPAAEPVAE